MFLTATEWKELGGRREGSTKTYRPLPFDCCALSLQPFEVGEAGHICQAACESEGRAHGAPLCAFVMQTPVCTPEGVIFDILNIIPYIQKVGNGRPLMAWRCPAVLWV